MGSPAEVGCGIMHPSCPGLGDNEGNLGQESFIIINKVSDHLASTLNGAALPVRASLVLQS